MTFPHFHDLISPLPDKGCCFPNPFHFIFFRISPLLIVDLFGEPTVVAMPVASMKLEDRVATLVVSIYRIRPDFLLFSSVEFMLNAKSLT
jgi:hypothetical protein